MKPFSYFDLLDAFVLSGCPVCRLLSADSERFIGLLLRESTTDPGIQQRFRASRGLCNYHAWQMREFKGYASSVAVLYEAALDELIDVLNSTASKNPATNLLRRISPSTRGDQAAGSLEEAQKCQCCELMDQAEQRYIHTIASHFGEEQMQEAYRASDGLCLPHFRLLIHKLNSGDHVRMVAEAQIRKWQSLKGEIDLYLRNLDGRRLQEPMGAEGDSWIRAIEIVAGVRGVFGMRRKRE